MKIAVFEPKFFTPRPYAVSYLGLLREQIRAFERFDNEIIVLAEGNGSVGIEGKCKIYQLRGRFTYLSSIFSSHRKNVPAFPDFFSLDIISNAIRILREESVDVIYTSGTPFGAFFTSILGYMSGIPTVHYVTDVPTRKWWKAAMLEHYEKPLKYILYQFSKQALRELPRREFIQKWALNNITQLIASSNYVKNNLVNFGLVSKQKEIPVVYPSVCMSPMNVSKDTDSLLITYFGHLSYGRGVLDLLMAFSRVVKQHPKAKLLIASTHVHELSEKHLLRLVEKHRLSSNLIRKGLVKDVYSEIIAPSTVITLLHRDYPTLKILESMAASKPVIATKVGWAPELIVDGVNGFLVGVGDIDETTKKINLLLDDICLANEIGRNARRTIEAKCDVMQSAKTIVNILKEAKRRLPL